MKSTSNNAIQKTLAIASPFLVFILTFTWLGLSDTTAMAQTDSTDSTRYSSLKDWNLKGENLVPIGHNPLYTPLKPGFRFIIEEPETDEGYFRKEILVLEETEQFDLPNFGKFECATVREDEFKDGVFVERSHNWICMDKVTNSVYSFGETSWEIKMDGHKVFEGTWRVGDPDGGGPESPNAEPGLLMPGTFNVGARYIFDGSESETFGGTENMETGVTVHTPAGTFENCVRVREYSITEPDDIVDKWWCPGIGLARDSSDGRLVASDALPHTDMSSFGKHHREKRKQTIPPVAKINGKEATQIALKEVPGDATSVSIERKLGKNVYVIEILAKADGVETDVFVDIESGEVVGTDK